MKTMTFEQVKQYLLKGHALEELPENILDMELTVEQQGEIEEILYNRHYPIGSKHWYNYPKPFSERLKQTVVWEAWFGHADDVKIYKRIK